MLPIAGQTAGLNGLNFFVDTHGWPGCFRQKNRIYFSTFFFPQAMPGPSGSLSYFRGMFENPVRASRENKY